MRTGRFASHFPQRLDILGLISGLRFTFVVLGSRSWRLLSFRLSYVMPPFMVFIGAFYADFLGCFYTALEYNLQIVYTCDRFQIYFFSVFTLIRPF